MEMVAQHAVALADPAVPRDGLADLRDEPAEVPIIQAHPLLCISSRRDVVERAGELDPRRSAHRSSVGLATTDCGRCQDFGTKRRPNRFSATGSGDTPRDRVPRHLRGPGRPTWPGTRSRDM